MRWCCSSSWNQDRIPQEMPALSTQQALQAVPKRLSDLRSETEGLYSTDKEQDNNLDEYAAEMDDAGFYVEL